MNKRFTLVILFIFQFIFLSLQAQVFEKKYSSYASICNFIVKDTLWIGSSNCLIKMLISENKIIRIYSSENSPIDGKVTSIWINKSNSVCVVIDKQKVALLSDDSWQTWSANDIMASGNTKVEFQCVSISDTGDIYCYEYYKKQIVSYSGNQWKKLVDVAAIMGVFKKFLQNPDGTIWWLNLTRTSNSISRLDSAGSILLNQNTLDVVFYKDGSLYGIESTGNIVKIKTNGTTVVKANLSISSFDYMAIGVGANEIVYVNVSKTLYVFKDKQITEYVDDKIEYNSRQAIINIDENGVAWINYTGENVISKFDNGVFSILKTGIYSERSVKANSDRTILWFNTQNYVCSHNIKTGEIRHFDIPTGGYPYEFAESIDPNQMWLATFKGLLHFDGKTWELKYDPSKPYDPAKPFNIYGLKALSSKQLVGMFTNGWTFYPRIYDINSQQWIELNNSNETFSSTKLFLDRTKQIWVCFDYGMAYFEKGNWIYLNTANSNMPSEKWNYLAFDSHNKLYATSNKNLYSYDGIKWELITDNFCDQTFGLFIDSRDWIWRLNSCPSLDYYDGIKWTKFDKANSNIPDLIYFSNFEEDLNGDIWVSSNPAIHYKLNLTANHDLRFDKQNLYIYPNPAIEKVSINLPENNGKISIYSSLGAEIFTSSISENSIQVSLDHILPGIYYVVWKNAINTITSKLLVIH